MAAGLWLYLRLEEDEPSVPEPKINSESTIAAPEHHPVPERNTETHSVSSPSPNDAGQSNPKGDGPEGSSTLFPEDYRGVRDRNMLELYSVYARSLEREAEKMKGSQTPMQAAISADLCAKYSAYIALIQQQRHFYYGYDRARGRLPRATSEVRYAASGMGDMYVVFELPKTEFPEVFEAAAELQRFTGLPR